VTQVVVAPDKFKGSLTAAARRGGTWLRGYRPGPPRPDGARGPGGRRRDGTVAAALAAGFRPVTATVTGPTG